MQAQEHGPSVGAGDGQWGLIPEGNLQIGLTSGAQSPGPGGELPGPESFFCLSKCCGRGEVTQPPRVLTLMGKWS